MFLSTIGTGMWMGASDYVRTFATVGIDLVEGRDIRTSTRGITGLRTAAVSNVAPTLT